MSWSEALYIINNIKKIISDYAIGTATVDDVLNGKTFGSGSGSTMLIGAMPDYSGESTDASNIAYDSSNVYVIPKKGYYDDTSKIKVSDVRKVFEVYNGSDMSKLLPNDYKKLTVDNFFVSIADINEFNAITNIWASDFPENHNGTAEANYSGITKSYDASTGIITVGSPTVTVTTWYGTIAKTRNIATSEIVKILCVYPL